MAYLMDDDAKGPERSLRRLVNIWRQASRLPYRATLAHGLRDLIDEPSDDGENWTMASVYSLRHLLKFLESARRMVEPVVTITPAGLFRAQWTRAPERHFATTFRADGAISYVRFWPDPNEPRGTGVGYGLIPDAGSLYSTERMRNWLTK